MIGAGVRERRKGEAKMPNLSFADVVCKMPKYLDELKACEPFAPDARGNLRRNCELLPKTKGVYCFYEGDKPLYVGRTDNINGRIPDHRQLANDHYQASFAFNIAKKDLEENHPDENVDGLSRDDLSENPTFDQAFTDAKTRVRKMSVRFVEIEDPIEQTIFEVYAHMELPTPPRFNSFANH